MTLRFFLAIFLLFGLMISEAQYERADELLSEMALDQDLAGMTVIGVCNGEVVYQFYYGLSDIERNIPTSSRTSYRIASIAKHISTLVALRMVSAGIIELDTDINQYLSFNVRNPFFPDEPITIRRLLYHHSSIIDGPTYGPFLTATFSGDLPPSIREYLTPGGSHYSPQNFNSIRPGTWFNYSNANFGLLATVLEAASQTRFDSLALNYLFVPMGWKGGFHPGYMQEINDLAVLYRKPGGVWTAQADQFHGFVPEVPKLPGYQPGANGLYFSPQGGARMTGLELAQAMKLHFQKGIWQSNTFIEESLMAEIIHPQWTYNGNNGNNYFGLFRSWGLGTHISTALNGEDEVFPGRVMMGHPGEAFGLVSDFYFDPEQQTGIILLINGSGKGYSFGSSAFYAVEEAVFDIVYNEVVLPCSLATSTRTKIDFNHKFRVYPNPAAAQLYISMDDAEAADYLILHINGQPISHGRVASSRLISIESLPPGNYILCVKTAFNIHQAIFTKI
jgi:CubicO group peptidase (beta-lactamase class C family)